MKHYPYEILPKLPKLKLAVIGHVEWMTFLSVDTIPRKGDISHAKDYMEAPAGGGAVTAVQMKKLTNSTVHFFTALGNDDIGQKCYQKLKIDFINHSENKIISFNFNHIKLKAHKDQSSNS